MTSDDIALKLITGPAVEPITVEEAKLHLRVDGSDDDYGIMRMVTAARDQIEKMTGLALVTQTWDQYFQDWQEVFELKRQPLSSVTSVNYKDENGAETVVATTVYVSDTAVSPPRIVQATNQSWPSAVLYPSSPIRIRFVAGYGTTSESVPGSLKHAILLLLGHFYQNRESVLVGGFGLVSATMPQSVQHLISNYRMRDF